MTINTNTIVSMSEANQNFSKVARMVDQFGKAVIFKNNSPKYIVLEFSAADRAYSTTDNADPASETTKSSGSVSYTAASREEVTAASRRLMEKYDAAYKELAQ